VRARLCLTVPMRAGGRWSTGDRVTTRPWGQVQLPRRHARARACPRLLVAARSPTAEGLPLAASSLRSVQTRPSSMGAWQRRSVGLFADRGISCARRVADPLSSAWLAGGRYAPRSLRPERILFGSRTSSGGCRGAAKEASDVGCPSVGLGPGVTSPKSRPSGMESRSRWLRVVPACPPGPAIGLRVGRRR
jgi:hypothetical protein